MKSFSLKIVLIACLVLQAGCEVTFKRKSPAVDSAQAVSQKSESMEQNDEASLTKGKPSEKPARAFNERDIKLITLYYANEGNAQVLDDMVKQTWVNNKIESQLTVNEAIPSDVQVMPLPLDLEKILSPLSAYALRVQVGKRVMIMDIKSRRILDVIKLK